MANDNFLGFAPAKAASIASQLAIAGNLATNAMGFPSVSILFTGAGVDNDYVTINGHIYEFVAVGETDADVAQTGAHAVVLDGVPSATNAGTTLTAQINAHDGANVIAFDGTAGYVHVVLLTPALVIAATEHLTNATINDVGGGFPVGELKVASISSNSLTALDATIGYRDFFVGMNNPVNFLQMRTAAGVQQAAANDDTVTLSAGTATITFAAGATVTTGDTVLVITDHRGNERKVEFLKAGQTATADTDYVVRTADSATAAECAIGFAAAINSLYKNVLSAVSTATTTVISMVVPTPERFVITEDSDTGNKITLTDAICTCGMVRVTDGTDAFTAGDEINLLVFGY